MCVPTKLTVAFVHVHTICPQFMVKVMIATVAAAVAAVVHFLEKKKRKIHTHTHSHTARLKIVSRDNSAASNFIGTQFFLWVNFENIYTYYMTTQ